MTSKISRDDLVRLFEQELSFLGASSWGSDRMQSQVAAIVEHLGDWKELDIQDELLNNILRTIFKTRGDIMIVDDEPTQLDSMDESQDADSLDGFYDSTPSEPSTYVEPDVKQQPAEPDVEPPTYVRHTKGRPYQAGRVIAEVGTAEGVTQRMVDMVEERCKKKNPKETRFALTRAWHAIDGFLGGG